jgi:hypothetical protein
MNIESIIKRYDVLASKIICSGYASKFGNYNSETKEYKLKNITNLNYFNSVTNKYFSVEIDSNAKIRNRLTDSELTVMPDSFYRLEDLIDGSDFVRGKKTRILKNILLPLFDDDAISMDYTPKEVMNFIEKTTNEKITFTDSNNPEKLYINPGTFKRVFYQAKKERNQDFSNYNTLINMANDLISQKGVAQSEKVKLSYESLDISGFSSLFLKPDDASKYDGFKSLEKYISLKHDDLEENIKDIIPCRTFKRIINNAKQDEYKILFDDNFLNNNEDALKKMIIENKDNVIFDPFNMLKYLFSSNMLSMISPIGGTINLLLGSKNPENMYAINGAISEELASSNDPHSPLTMKNLKEIIDDEDKKTVYYDKFNNFIAASSQH